MSESLQNAMTSMVGIIQTISDVLQEREEIPAGELYGILMTFGCTKAQYDRLENILIESGKVVKERNVLKWNQ